MNPNQVMIATISHTTRTSVTSMSKYSENPRHTPAIFRPMRGRISLVRASDDPDPTAAIGANIRIVLNHFSAIVAVHGSALTE